MPGFSKLTDHKPPPELDELRAQIDDLDTRLVELLAERQAAVSRVADIKKEHGLPLFHPAREEDLISQRRAQGEAAGLQADWVEEIFRQIIRRSRVSQSGDMVGHAVKPGAVILIVGGHGAMGRWFQSRLSVAGYEVRVLEKDGWAEVDEICTGVDLALLAVPIEKTETVAHCLGSHLPENCILADITSIKARPVQAMMAAHKGPVVGLHPMYGPTTSSMDKQIVVVTPGRGEEHWSWVVDQFASWGAVVLHAEPEEHDEIMALVQSLRHFATFAFGQFLFRRRADLHRSLDFSSPIYRLELAMVGRLFAQDPGLYAEIIFATPERRAMLKDYLVSVNENLNMIVNGDRDGFMEEFGKIAEWFGPFSDQAIRESSFLIEKLIERF